jgi:5-carboxymethyl-2-hydroxymuconate isomerase
MPTIHLTTTPDLPENASVPQILEALVAELSTIETVPPAAVKAFHTLAMVWVMGEGGPAGFASCQIAVLAGRPESIRVEIAERLHAVMKERFSQSLASGEVGITLEVREMEKATYRK